MALSDPTPIWYASYGSNCLAERFERYLTGGRAQGASRPEPGARDRRLPAESAACWLPHGVRFLGDSAKWGGGGVAFLDHEPAIAKTAGRRYLITHGQFEDIAAQESGRGRFPLTIDGLQVGRVHPIGSGAYDGLLALPPIDGVPVVTFTSPLPLTGPVAAPSPAYLRTILRGLLEVHELTEIELISHVRRAPGVKEGWTGADMLRLFEK